MVEDAVPLDEVRRVLVIKLRHHGDVLLASPVFSVLKAHAPHIEIDALVYAETVDMLSLHPAIADLHVIDREWKRSGTLRQLTAESALLRRLRRRKYQLLIHLTEHWRGAWLARALGVRWAVTPEVAGRNRLWARSFTHFVGQPRAGGRHVVESNLDALRRIGVYPSESERGLVLVPGFDAERRVDERLASLGLAPKRFVHVHPASRWRFKCWPSESMAKVIEALQSQGMPVILTAGPDPAEKRMIEDIQGRLSRPALSLAGELSLKELAALASRARLFVGVDSAPMHVAAAVGTPTVAIFGPSGDRQWGPWQVRGRVVASRKHSCRPCGIDGCGAGKLSDCLVSLAPDEVLQAVAELMSE